MDLQGMWEKALRGTEVIRPRVQPLSILVDTQMPYIFLAESSVNMGDSIVRKGEVRVEKPSIILPPHLPQFEGFESDKGPQPDLDMLANIFLVRGIHFPSFKYNNKTSSIDIYEGRLKAAIELYKKQLEREENLTTGLVVGPEDCWQFCLIIFIASQVLRQAEGDIRGLLERFRKDQHG